MLCVHVSCVCVFMCVYVCAVCCMCYVCVRVHMCIVGVLTTRLVCAHLHAWYASDGDASTQTCVHSIGGCAQVAQHGHSQHIHGARVRNGDTSHGHVSPPQI